MVGLFYKVFFNRPSRYAKLMTKNALVQEQIMKIIWGSVPAVDGFKIIAGQYSIPSLSSTQKAVFLKIAGVMNRLFRDSSDLDRKGNSQPLGLMAEHLVMRITGLEDPNMPLLLENPLLHSYGKIEEQYLESIKLLKDFDTGKVSD